MQKMIQSCIIALGFSQQQHPLSMEKSSTIHSIFMSNKKISGAGLSSTLKIKCQRLTFLIDDSQAVSFGVKTLHWQCEKLLRFV